MEVVVPPVVTDVKQYILDRVTPDPVTGCWIWQRARTSRGYGSVGLIGYPTGAHQVAYLVFVGPLPYVPYGSGERLLDVDHLCDTPPCCNPQHLEAKSHYANVKRWSDGITHCPAGHEYTADNTYLTPRGSRVCRSCRRERDAIRRATPERQAYREEWLARRSPQEASV